jgi:hypothetical protein
MESHPGRGRMAEPGLRAPEPSGQAALIAWSLLAYPETAGSPMIRASPQPAQPHSGQSPSGTSGQLARSAWNCSNTRSSLHPEQYLVNCIILATSSV